MRFAHETLCWGYKSHPRNLGRLAGLFVDKNMKKEKKRKEKTQAPQIMASALTMLVIASKQTRIDKTITLKIKSPSIMPKFPNTPRYARKYALHCTGPPG
jgi:hypothetical protein